MKRSLILFLLILASYTSYSQIDTIYADGKMYDPSLLPIGKDSYISFRVENEEKSKTAINAREILLKSSKHGKSYTLRTWNIPGGEEDTTSVEAEIDFDTYEVQWMYLKAEADSAYVVRGGDLFTGWSQLPDEDQQIVDFKFEKQIFPMQGNTPWVPGLVPMYEGKIFAIPYLGIFSNQVRWTTYTVVAMEEVIIGNRNYISWKVDAGPLGPPGYRAYHYYQIPTGKLINAELVNPDAAVYYYSEIITI